MVGYPDPAFWANKTVFVTGHMGFKGSWLLRILARFGAHTVGYGRDDRERLLYFDLQAENHRHVEGDVADYHHVKQAIEATQPDVLVHLAAQPIVLQSYQDPLETYQSNVMGTAVVLNAARDIDSLRAIVIVTSDKVYQNNEWQWPYRETDRLGGHDPYSSSKAAAEVVTNSMVSSFYGNEGQPVVASARAGNVIGGGDWADYRLLPDAVRAFEAGQPLLVRNPHSTRPWQHVLEPLGGYLVLAEQMHAEEQARTGAWNFGPVVDDAVPVQTVADAFVDAWGDGAEWQLEGEQLERPKEANFLAVDTSKARTELGWQPRWRVQEAVARTAVWYREFLNGCNATDLMDYDISDYFELNQAMESE